MAANDPWPTIHAERAAVADDLQAPSDAQWTTPSLCADWSVRDVLGHMTATARMTPALVLAMTGRRKGLDDLTGDGVGTLRDRS